MYKRVLFWLALLLQIALLLMIPIPRWLILTYGRTVLLETEPYDPYTVFSGYYADLRLKISNPGYLSKRYEFKDQNNYYVVLTPDKQGVWQPLRITRQLPHSLGKSEVALKGKLQYYQMKYGIEQYYLPEAKRRHINQLLRNRQNQVLVVAKVGRDGTAVVQELRIGGQVFRY
ncbi:MAG TPA: GDYXXLXY domain-containing protein [Bacillota bacterium]|nr:GDYXXLXY domain-containing protein [Bacillota bacterium]